MLISVSLPSEAAGARAAPAPLEAAAAAAAFPGPPAGRSTTRVGGAPLADRAEPCPPPGASLGGRGIGTGPPPLRRGLPGWLPMLQEQVRQMRPKPGVLVAQETPVARTQPHRSKVKAGSPANSAARETRAPALRTVAGPRLAHRKASRRAATPQADGAIAILSKMRAGGHDGPALHGSCQRHDACKHALFGAHLHPSGF